MSKIAKSPFKNKRNRPKPNMQQGECEGVTKCRCGSE